MIYQVTIRVNGKYKTIPIDAGHKLDAEFKAVSANGGVVVDPQKENYEAVYINSRLA